MQGWKLKIGFQQSKVMETFFESTISQSTLKQSTNTRLKVENRFKLNFQSTISQSTLKQSTNARLKVENRFSTIKGYGNRP